MKARNMIAATINKPRYKFPSMTHAGETRDLASTKKNQAEL